MTPFWSDGATTVYCGDCRDLLQQLTYDGLRHIVSAPPYWGVGYARRVALGLEPYEPMTQAKWHIQLAEWLGSWLPLLYVGSENVKGRVFLDLPCEHLPTVMLLADQWRWPVEHFWYKPDDAAMVVLGRSLPEADLDRIGQAFKASRHPAELDPNILDALVACCDGLVLDPFMGRGGTLLACQRANLRSIGIELDPAICQQAVARLSHAHVEA